MRTSCVWDVTGADPVPTRVWLEATAPTCSTVWFPSMGTKLEPFEFWNCFACGPNHPKGLRLTFEQVDERIRTSFRLGDDFTGTGGIVHGGIVATVFDETMAWCLLRFRKKLHFTTKLETRYRQPVRPNTDLVAEAWVDRVRSRGMVEMSATLAAADAPDSALAQASGVFIEAPADALDALPESQRTEMERILAGFDS